MSSPGMKVDVKSYWERKVCGAVYGMDRATGAVDLERMAEARYRLEPYIPGFADFPSGRGKRVLEIGIGGGVDFSNWIRHGAQAVGIDLTQAGVAMTRQRLAALDVPVRQYAVMVGDAENLAFDDRSFDLVYAYGVLHHSPDTARALCEVYRVLKPGGRFKGLIYHVHCWVGLMFWFRYSLLTGRPWKSPRRAMFEHLESPGTKTYTKAEAAKMLSDAGFTDAKIWTQLSFGDLLQNTPREKYRSTIYKLAFKVYPRWLVRALGDRWGMSLYIEATK